MEFQLLKSNKSSTDFRLLHDSLDDHLNGLNMRSLSRSLTWLKEPRRKSLKTVKCTCMCTCKIFICQSAWYNRVTNEPINHTCLFENMRYTHSTRTGNLFLNRIFLWLHRNIRFLGFDHSSSKCSLQRAPRNTCLQ